MAGKRIKEILFISLYILGAFTASYVMPQPAYAAPNCSVTSNYDGSGNLVVLVSPSTGSAASSAVLEAKNQGAGSVSGTMNGTNSFIFNSSILPSNLSGYAVRATVQDGQGVTGSCSINVAPPPPVGAQSTSLNNTPPPAVLGASSDPCAGYTGQAYTDCQAKLACQASQGKAWVEALGNQCIGFNDFFSNMFSYITMFAGIIAAFVFVVGAYNYLASRGDPSKLTEGREMITNAIIGLILIGTAVAIVKFLNGAFQSVDSGINLLGPFIK